MGFGDDIMATARVRALYAANPVPVLIQGLDRQPRWSAIWEHNPKIARTAALAGQVLCDGPGARPHLDYGRMTEQRFFFRAQIFGSGEIFLADAERARARPVVLIEPHVKEGASPNKDWGFARFQAVVDARPDLPWAQCDYGTPVLAGVEPIRTATFRDACAVLSGAVAAVLPEGGMHHAAAALGVRAVVIFGAYISPAVTGYAGHVNLARDLPDVVGINPRHPRAQAALANITTEEVLAGLEAILP